MRQRCGDRLPSFTAEAIQRNERSAWAGEHLAAGLERLLRSESLLQRFRLTWGVPWPSIQPLKD